MPPAAKGDKALATLENHLLARGLNALLVNTMTPIGYQAIYEHTGLAGTGDYALLIWPCKVFRKIDC